LANYKRIAAKEARRAGISPKAFVRQIRQESGFNPNARSPAGARGIAQFMPGTAKGLGVNPDNPREALRGSAKLMASYQKKYGSYRKALIAYNAGPGRVNGPLPAETRNYIRTILPGGEPKRPTRRGGGGGGTRSSERTRRIPGKSNAALRQQVAASYFAERGRPGALLRLSEGLKGAKDVPGRTVTSKGVGQPKGGSQRPSGKGKPNIVELGKLAQGMGLRVGEQSKFGGKPTGGHAPNSWHYKDRAIDVGGDPKKLARYNKVLAKRYGKNLKELFYDPGTNIKDGKRTGGIGGHGSHVHVAA
jgi:hypothetical protein